MTVLRSSGTILMGYAPIGRWELSVSAGFAAELESSIHLLAQRLPILWLCSYLSEGNRCCYASWKWPVFPCSRDRAAV